MKLRNKKTGKIRNAVDIDMYTDSVYLKVSDGEFDNETIEYHSLAELNAEWEDYEEDKRYWYIDVDGEVMSKEMAWFNQQQDDIGNRFGTKEEAEKAVEKLKAWKRLKDKGFEFYNWHPDAGISFGLWSTEFEKESVRADLDLLFEGEE